MAIKRYCVRVLTFDERLGTELGSRLVNSQSQKMTVAARAMADRKTFGHLS